MERVTTVSRLVGISDEFMILMMASALLSPAWKLVDGEHSFVSRRTGEKIYKKKRIGLREERHRIQ